VQRPHPLLQQAAAAAGGDRHTPPTRRVKQTARKTWHGSLERIPLADRARLEKLREERGYLLAAEVHVPLLQDVESSDEVESSECGVHASESEVHASECGVNAPGSGGWVPTEELMRSLEAPPLPVKQEHP